MSGIRQDGLGRAVLLAALFLAVTFWLIFRSPMSGEKGKSRINESAWLDAEGAAHLPPMTVPFSRFASPGAKDEFLRLQQYSTLNSDHGPRSIEDERRAVLAYYEPSVLRVASIYPVLRRQDVIAGVQVDVFTPVAGISARNAHRILINLHGGAFRFGAEVFGALESIPVASLARIEVISVDYRLAPEYRYPSATEDAVRVYRELIKTHAPLSIGIYGCSAGGLLTAEVAAWLAKQDLPEPGALGIFCASAAGPADGDSGATAPPLNGLPLSAAAVSPPHPRMLNAAYFADADLGDPLVLPIESDELLSKFPPTLFVTATRDSALSGAAHTHAQLTRLGVEASLHVWDGLGHGFFTTQPDLRETREALDVVVKFFDQHLAVTP